MSAQDDDFATFQASMIKPSTKMSKRMMKAYQLGPQETVQPELQSNSSGNKKSTQEQVTLTLTSANDTFQFKSIPLFQDVPVKIGRLTSPKQPPTEDNLIFDSKVLSRTHAEVLYNGTSVVIKDLGSSNGTFVNAERLSAEGVPSVEPKQLNNGDILEFGVDILDEDGVTLLYHKISCNIGIKGLAVVKVSEPMLPESAVQQDTLANDVVALLKEDFQSVQRQSETINKLKSTLVAQQADEGNSNQLSQLQETINSKIAENKQLEAELVSCKAALQKLQQKSTKLQQEFQIQIKTLTSEKDALQKQVNQLQSQLAAKNQEASQRDAQYENQLQSLNQQVAISKSQSEDLKKTNEQEVKDLKLQVQKAKKEVTNINLQTQKSQDVQASLSTKSDSGQSLEIIALQNQCNALKKELEDARSQDSSQQQHKSELAAMQGLLELKEQEFSELSKKLKLYKCQDQEMIDLRKQLTVRQKPQGQPVGISVAAVLFVAILSAILSYAASNWEFIVNELEKLVLKV